jgi:site-specific DNA recombinase
MSTVLEAPARPAASHLATAAKPARAAVYVRISSDPTGAGLGVARQEEDCRALCERLGWPVLQVYRDNDVSAYSGKPRPAWRQLLSDIDAGLVDAVACWHVDRLTRSPRELEEVIDLHDKRGIALATVTGELDLSTPTGRMLARMLGAAARHEAEHKAERHRRAGLQKARAGKPHRAGNRRGYGYQPDCVTPIPAEAAIIAEAAARALAGESVRSIAADLNQRAVPTVTGAAWSPLALRQILISGRISGRREYHGDIACDQSWPAVITPDQSDQLRILLARRPGTRASSRRYLLSGILTCGRCGQGLYARAEPGRPARYLCIKEPGRNGCGTIHITAHLADDEVRDRILTALDTPQFIAALITAAGGPDDADDTAAQLRAIETRRDELAATWAAGDITRKEWLTARDHLNHTASQLTSRLARTTHGRALAQFATMTGTVWDRWDTLTTGARRALIQSVAAAIPVHPATPGRWNPDRIGHPIWRA